MRFDKTLNQWKFLLGDLKTDVILPHTWNVNGKTMFHRGEAQYETSVWIEDAFAGKKIYLKFNAVYHTATVIVNSVPVGGHSRSGYTPFRLDITDAVIFGSENRITVRVNNGPVSDMLPYESKFDWADDGGIIRRVTLEVREPDGIGYMHVSEQVTRMENGLADGRLAIRTDTDKPRKIRVYEYGTGKCVAEGSGSTVPFHDLKMWSFDSPNLYLVTMQTDNDLLEERIGIRTFETKGEKVYLNGREIFLKGCEWMPGSHPDFGMAEPLDHSTRCLRQLKASGCVFTRFHWQQDDAVFDWCDENGLLVQEEIPYWGYPKEATSQQLDIARMQADEMIRFHFNHPSVVCWGVGNELGGHLDATIGYVKEMIAHFRMRDPRRLVNYVSNTLSLASNADRDDATLYGDIAMWNDYLGLWEKSDDIPAHMARTCSKAAGMPLLISEFGLCEPRFKGGDEERSRILRERLALYEKIPNICGYVWFSLNDYRTHMGEEGDGKFRRRVHGSTDIYGNEKPSYRLLCSLQNG